MSARTSISTTAVLTAALASLASAQQLRNPVPVQGPVKDAGIYHAATNTWTHVSHASNFGPDVLFRNDAPALYYGEQYANEVFTDEGRIPTLASGANSNLYEINGFQFGYCAYNLNPTSCDFSWFDTYAPCTDPIGLTPVGTFSISGMPNGGCWVVTVDMVGSGSEFVMEGDGANGGYDMDATLDSFGFQYILDNGQGGTTSAGPLLTWEPTLEGQGTKWNNPGAVAGSGLGSTDNLWVDSTFVAPGCYFWGGYPASATAHFVMYGDKASAGPTPYCAPGGANSVSGGGAVMTSSGGFGTASASFDLLNVPTQPGLIYSGANQIQIPFGCGDRCCGGNNVRGVPFQPASTSVSGVIFDMSTSSNLNVQYWYRDPMNFAACGSAFNLSNALGL